ncbi:hypothetical protein E2C01_025886 [Portunus trituberculatus]|uniref:Uncharacterized protein n=1 Tax=Portunus trituberculatus TaxID=210409 RepID=A0A5B7EEE0_PORTR|nr:hypothetical protein [Portunus trituberculatus]
MGEITTSTIPQWTYSHVRDRRTHTLLARLRIGHTYLTQRYLLIRDPQPYCDDCLVPLTVRHLLVECPSLTTLVTTPLPLPSVKLTLAVAAPKENPSIHLKHISLHNLISVGRYGFREERSTDVYSEHE